VDYPIPGEIKYWNLALQAEADSNLRKTALVSTSREYKLRTIPLVRKSAHIKFPINNKYLKAIFKK
jgi:hypothetical protein